MKKIYIAGKVTGEPIAECTMKFGTAQVQIRELGFIAVNPLEVVNDFKTPWRPAMQKCITALMDCDAIYFCHDWKDSPGAQLEAKIAEGFQMPFFHSIQELRKHPEAKPNTYPDRYCFECEIEMPVKEKQGVLCCSKCGLRH